MTQDWTRKFPPWEETDSDHLYYCNRFPKTVGNGLIDELRALSYRILAASAHFAADPRGACVDLQALGEALEKMIEAVVALRMAVPGWSHADAVLITIDQAPPLEREATVRIEGDIDAEHLVQYERCADEVGASLIAEIRRLTYRILNSSTRFEADAPRACGELSALAQAVTRLIAGMLELRAAVPGWSPEETG